MSKKMVIISAILLVVGISMITLTIYQKNRYKEVNSKYKEIYGDLVESNDISKGGADNSGKYSSLESINDFIDKATGARNFFGGSTIAKDTASTYKETAKKLDESLNNAMKNNLDSELSIADVMNDYTPIRNLDADYHFLNPIKYDNKTIPYIIEIKNGDNHYGYMVGSINTRDGSMDRSSVYLTSGSLDKESSIADVKVN